VNSWRRTNLDELKNSRPWPFVLFLDDGGVLNDNRLRRPEWQRLIGEFMPARLGGTVDQWTSANRVVFPEVWANVQKRLPVFASHDEFQRTYATNWISAMCACVGIAPPRNDEAVTLYRELSIYVSKRATSAIAGAADAVLSLHRAGYTLYTASATPSWELRGISAKMGIAETISELYGPDLVDQVKYGPIFYQKVFAHAAVAPARALVIESDPECCRWASEVGASAIWIDADGRGDAKTLEALVHSLV
jgi:beta-phosphoglucomutase-like phosphatase (HAD superfamily)